MLSSNMFLLRFCLAGLLSFSLCSVQAETAQDELDRRFYNSYEAEATLASSVFYTLSSKTDFLYQGYSGTESDNVFDGTSYFIEQLKNKSIDFFPNATWIPIAGDITIFIPSVGPLPKRVGTPFVEKGLIKYQIQELIGRSWIGGYSSVEAQTKALAENGADFGEQYELSFGQNLTIEQMQDVAEDLIWPEIRNIHGQDVLVSVVYLSEATYIAQQINGNLISFGAANLDYKSVSINGASAEVLRDLVVNVKESFVNTQGSVVAGTVDIEAGQDIQNLSGVISGDTVRLTANNIENRTLVIRHDYEYGYNEYADTLAVIESVGDLTINTTKDYLDSGGSLLNQGAQIIAGGYLDVEAEGDIQIVSQPLSAYHSQEGSFWSQTSSSVQNLQSQLSGSDITLFAHEALVVEGASIESPGMIELLANMGLYIIESINSETYEYTFEVKARGFTQGGSAVYNSSDVSETEDRQRTEVLQTIIKAGKDVSIRSNGSGLDIYGQPVQSDVVLRAIDLEAGGDLSIIAQNGAVHFNVAKDLDYYSYTYHEEDLLTFESSGEGHQIERGYYNQLLYQGILTVDETTGIYVEYVIPHSDEDEEPSLDAILDAVSVSPEFAWLDALRCKNLDASADCQFDSIQWTEVQTAFDEWEYDTQGLTKAGAALVAIVVSVVTGGAGTGIVEAFTASAATTAGTAAATLTATQAAVATILQAGVTTLANQSVNALYATGFDLGETLDVMGSSENVRQLASSLITAGVMPSGDVFSFGEADLNFWQHAANGVANSIVRAGYTAVVQGSVFGYNSDEYLQSFGTALAANAIEQLGKAMATEIGIAARANDIQTATQYIAHAAAGCLTGALTADLNDTDAANGCVSGGAGAVLGEYIAERNKQPLKDDIQAWAERRLGEPGTFSYEEFDREVRSFLARGADIGRLAAGFAAFATGGDVSIAGASAFAAANYNSNGELAALTSHRAFASANRINAIRSNPLAFIFSDVFSTAGSDMSQILSGEELDIGSWDAFDRNGTLSNLIRAAANDGLQNADTNLRAYLAMAAGSILSVHDGLFGDQNSVPSQGSIVEGSENDVYTPTPQALMYDLRNAYAELAYDEQRRLDAVEAANTAGQDFFEERIVKHIENISQLMIQHQSFNEPAAAFDSNPLGSIVYEESSEDNIYVNPAADSLDSTFINPIPDIEAIGLLIHEIAEPIDSSTVTEVNDNVGLPSHTSLPIHETSPSDQFVFSEASNNGSDDSSYAVTDFPDVSSKVSQKQLRHIAGRDEYRGGGVLDSLQDAQEVLDSYNSGEATILGRNRQGFPVIRYDGVTGTNINVSVGITDQPTNVFVIKGTASPSVVPINPNWTP